MKKDCKRKVSKFIIAFLAAFAVCFTVVIFGPFELYMSNIVSFDFKLSDFMPWLVLITICISLIFALISLLLNEKVYNWVLTLSVWLLISSYLQGNVLNKDYGTLDGTKIAWENYRLSGICNAGIWLLLLGVLVVLLYKFTNIWKYVTAFAPSFFVAIQGVALVTVLLMPEVVGNTTELVEKQGNSEYYINAEKAFELSEKDNVVVFILDNYGNDLLNRTVRDFPDALDKFHDFTYYNDCSGSVKGTFPGICTIVTGVSYDPTKPYEYYFDNAWKQESVVNFFDKLHEEKYETFVYGFARYLAGEGDIEAMDGKFDNVVSIEQGVSRTVNNKKLVAQIEKLSLYRYVPDLLKRFFWMNTSDFFGLVTYGEQMLCQDDDVIFYNRLIDEGITLNKNVNKYNVYHLRGPHDPWNMDENCKYVDESTTERQGRGSLKIVEDFMEQMKEKNIYDSSTIIVTADHGTTSHLSPILFVKKAGESHEEMVMNEAPIIPNDIVPTIYSIITEGEELKGAEGRNLFLIDEDEQRMRSPGRFMKDDAFEYVGNYSVMYYWDIQGNTTDFDYDNEKPSRKVQLKDGFYR